MNAIEIRNLTRDYGGSRGVFDLSFSVEKGEVFGFLGPNGAGKTTTIRHLMGFIGAREGSVTISGMDCVKQRVQIQKTLGYIPGEINFFDDMTGAQFIDFLRNYRGHAGANRTRELLERFELNPSGKIKKMSKGTKQKIGVVAAFAHDPDILILDEPTSGLDPLMQNRFIELINEEKTRGKTILMSSHMFEEVERTCHRVAIIRAGRLAALDSVSALKQKQLKKFVVTFRDAESAEKFASEFDGANSRRANRVTTTIKCDVERFIDALRGYRVTDLTTPNQNLEEIFMQYYGGDAQ